MKILGISAFYHDSAACIIENEKIIAAVQEERFTRKKHDSSFPVNAIKFCLKEANISINEIDAIAFYDKAFLKFERLLETYYSYAPKGLLSFLKSMPIWIKEKLFIKKLIFDELKKIEKFDKKNIKLLFPEHHLSHSSSAFYPSPFKEAAIVTVDGVGEWATASIGYGYENKIKVYKELHFPHSVGLLYSAFTYFLGFRVNSGEYKLMGLAPYADKNSEQAKDFIKKIKDNLVEIKDDGSVFLEQKYFGYSTGLKMINENKWGKLFGFAVRHPESQIENHHANLAFAIQSVTEEIVFKMAKEAKKLSNSKNLCLAGGVALNCVSNGKILSSGLFENIFVQPAAGDAGGALGSAFATYHIFFNKDRKITDEDKMQGALLGNSYDNASIEKALKESKVDYEYFDSFEKLSKGTAKLLSEGNIIGWFRGKMEFGPRALGNRSILADARNIEMQRKLNLKIKNRESFRPFAPVVMSEHVSDYFEINTDSPYMLFTVDVAKNKRKEKPKGFEQLSIKEKLKIPLSQIPAVTHVDYSARIQTVNKKINNDFWELLNAFKNLTGDAILVNTSFNVRGEPIVCTPKEAIQCFKNTEMDVVVIENYLIKK
ncbi:MAG: carbamoyltransferase [Bacteroidota bacterium]|nr:carbamoyltransferase [Bacteroidota bacterium]